MKIHHSVVIITGASSGIGKATAHLLHEKGARVVLASRSVQQLEELSATLPGSYVVPCDLTRADDITGLVQKAIAHFDRVDILVNNAGRGYVCPIEKIQVQHFHELFQLNVVGPLLAMQAVIPGMRRQGRGMIVTVSSGTSLMYPPGVGGYACLKGALNGLSHTARQELAGNGIAVSIVYPYITKTDFHTNLIGADPARPFRPELQNPQLPPADPPEYIAGKIVEAITTEAPEVFAHDWMKASQLS